MAKIKVKKRDEKPTEDSDLTYKNRYVAAIQDVKDSNLYVHFAESNTLSEIKSLSEKEVTHLLKAEKIDVGVLVMDHENVFNSLRYNLPAQCIAERDHKGKIKDKPKDETRIKSWVKDK